MREACLSNNWSFVPMFLNIYRALMRWTPWSFLGEEVAVMSPHNGGTHLEWGVEDRGMRSLSQILWDECLSYPLKRISTGEHSLHISWRSTEHSSPTSIFPVFVMTSWIGNLFRITVFCAENSPVTAGNSLVTGEFPSHRPVTRSFDVFFELRLNKRLSKQSRRRWFAMPLCSLWRHCNVVPSNDPVIRAAVGSFSFQRVTLVQFWIGETGQIEGFRALWKEWTKIRHTAIPWLPFLEINYILHSTAVWYKFAVSDHP